MSKKKTRIKMRDVMTIIDHEIGDDEGERCRVDAGHVFHEASQAVYDARIRAGWTLKRLADRVGVKPSVIEAIEEGVYERHTLKMHHRIAYELDLNVQIRFTPKDKFSLRRNRRLSDARFGPLEAQRKSRRTGRQIPKRVSKSSRKSRKAH
jgi:ribosome-binding protein aMBF1 (putative translation factor)